VPVNKIRRIFLSKKDQKLIALVKQLTGFTPIRLEIYREALRHSSIVDLATRKNEKNRIKDNERLEFLGDAILDAVVADLLFMRYPFKEEGFMTEMRTRIVSRQQLTNLAHKMGLVQYMEIHPDVMRNPQAMKTVGCNALEALIGAVYLDKGYSLTRRFIIRKLIDQYLDLEKVMEMEISYKSKLLKWAQKNQKKLSFESERIESDKRHSLHKVSLVLDGETLMTDINHSKKLAEELACEKACKQLGI
jgi:ribonuclease III